MTEQWAVYRRRIIDIEMRPYVPGEQMTGIAVRDGDALEEGGMIARNSQDHTDQWYVGKAYFQRTFMQEPLGAL